MFIPVLPIYLLGIQLEIRNLAGHKRQDGDISGAKTLKQEKHCALPANQQTMQAQMDGQTKSFQDLASAGFDALSLWERVNGDMDLLRDLVELFAAEYPGL